MSLPAEVKYLCAGVDPNKRFIAAEIVGFGDNEETWGICYREIHGPVESRETWRKLEKFLRSRWSRGNEKKPLVVSMACVDSRYKSHLVKPWCRARRLRGIVPIVGSTTLGKPFIGPCRSDPESHADYYELGTHEIKDVLMTRLEQPANVEDEDGAARAFPAGFCHFPKSPQGRPINGYTQKYFKELLAEDAMLRKGPDGKFYPFFEKRDPHIRNEALDCRVYALAAERILTRVIGIKRRESRDDDRSGEN